MTQIKMIPYHNWQNCYQVTSQHLSLTVTSDVGPRILCFNFPDKQNVLYEEPDQQGLTGGDKWRAYGGHRLWIAPEDSRTVFPDNRPVTVETLPDGLRLTPPLEETTGFQKSIQIKMYPDSPRVHLIHNLMNQSSQASFAAPWALTVMTSGGVAILPHSPRHDWPEKLTAQNTLSLWSYTDMTDPRWTWGRRYILLQQTDNQSKPQKVGMLNSEGWVAYLVKGFLFIKFFTTKPDSGYPDLNSNLETWTNQAFLELETLGPLVNVQPGQTITHLEDWFLFEEVPAIKTDDDVDQAVLPLVRKCQAQITAS
jgi:hypothetical protein